MYASILPLASLTALPMAELAEFGVKTAGVVELMNLEPDSPVPYLVPDGWAIPAGASSDLAEADIRRAFDDLTGKMPSKGALLVRSSALDENPGQNITRFVAYQRDRIDESFALFCNAIHEVGESKDTMGVLLMPLVGGLSMLTDGREALGWNNVSFVADSHSPFNLDEVFVAMVHGLGTRVVEAGSEFISMTAERKTGWISSIGNCEEYYILLSGKDLRRVRHPSQYRQHSADFFSVQGNGVESALLGLGAGDYEKTFGESSDWEISEGKLRGEDGKVARLPPNLKKKNDPRQHNVQDVGFIPLQTVQGHLNLIGVLQYLSGQSGSPVQIEGAFTDPSSEIPVLYQKIDMPLPPATKGKVPKYGADIVSSRVIGSCDIRGPLLFLNHRICHEDELAYHGETAAAIDELERSGTPYTLFAPDHNAFLISKTPNCRVRISGSNTIENVSSHPVSHTRLRQSREPSAGYVLAMGVEIPLKSLRRKFRSYDRNGLWRIFEGYWMWWRDIPDFFLYKNARVRANGKTLAVQLEPERLWPLRNLLRRLFG